MTDVSDAPVEAAPEAVDAPVADVADAPETGDAFAEIEEGLASGSLSPEEGLKQIKELRKENQKYRERFQPFEQTFGAIHPDDAQFFYNLASLAAQGNRDGLVEAFRTAIDTLSPAEQAEVEAAAEEATPEKPVEELVAEKVNEILKAREEAAEQRSIQAQVTAKMTDLGFDDPGDPTAQLVLLTARNIINDDPTLTAVDAVEKAHEAVQAKIAERATEYAKAKAKTAPAVDAGSPPPGNPTPAAGAVNPMQAAAELAKKRLLAEAAQRAGRDMT